MDKETTVTEAVKSGEVNEETKVATDVAAETTTATKEVGEAQTEEQKTAKTAEDEKAKREQEARDHKAKTEARINQRIALSKVEAAKEREAKEKALEDKHKAELEAAELRGRLAAQSKGIDPNVPPVRPKIEDFETAGDFNNAMLDYTDKLTDWKVNRIDEARKKDVEELRKSAPVIETPEQKTAREKDYAIVTMLDKVRIEFGEDAVDIIAADPKYTDFRSTQIMRDAILEDQNGVKILGYFAENPRVSAQIAAMSAPNQIREIDKLSKSLIAKKETQAAPPITPVDGKAGGGKVDPSKMTDTEHLAWRKQQKINSA